MKYYDIRKKNLLSVMFTTLIISFISKIIKGLFF